MVSFCVCPNYTIQNHILPFESYSSRDPLRIAFQDWGRILTFPAVPNISVCERCVHRWRLLGSQRAEKQRAERLGR